MYIDLPFVGICTVKIVLSILFGFLLGVERKSRNHFVGSRTLILISVSATLLTIASSYMADYQAMFSTGGGDPTRISAGLVSGIGFLGGGAILRQGLNVKGLTTAAVIWTASALGLAVGAGLYIESIIVLAAVLFLLQFLGNVEDKIFPYTGTKILHVYYDDANIKISDVKNAILSLGVIVHDANVDRDILKNTAAIHFVVKFPKNKNIDTSLLDELKKAGSLARLSLGD